MLTLTGFKRGEVMNTKAKEYAKQCLEKQIDANKIGFLLIENFERKPHGKWPFLGSSVFVAEIDRKKMEIETIDGQSLDGADTFERIKSFMDKYNPNSRICSERQFLWSCEQLSQFLLFDERSPEVFDICKRLSKHSFSPEELEGLCKSINDFNKRIYQEANERETLISRAN